MAVDVIIDPLTGQIYWNDSQNTAQSIAISGNGSDLIKLIGYSLQFAGAPSGTLSAANNTTTITGSGTNFTTLFGSGAAANGAILYTIQGTSIGIVSSVTNDTTLVLQSNASGNYNNISFRIAPPSGTDRIIFSDSSTPLKPATTGSGLGDATYRWSLYASDINASGTVTLTNPLSITNGGTNTSSYSTTNSIIYFDGSKFANTNTLASGVVVTDVSRVPAISTDIPTAVTIGSKYIYRADGTDIPLADGGTNASLTAVSGGVVYSTTTAFAITSQGSSGQALRSGGSGAPTFGTLGTFGGGTGLSSIGGSNSVLGVNNAASALEYKSLVGTNISVDHSPSTVTFTCNNVTTGNNGQVVIYNGTSTVGPGPGLDYNSGTSGFEWIFYLYNPNKTALKVMGTSSQVAPIFDVSTISTTVFEINNVGNISKGTWNASTIGVLYGGTGTTAFSSNSVIIESGGNLSSITGTNNQILTVESGIPKYFSISGDLTSSTPGNITIANGAVTSDRIGNNAVSFSKLPAASGASIIGAPFSSSTVFQAVTATTSGNVLRMSGTAIGFGALDLSSSNAVSNQLSILNGGTGQSTATSAINALLPSQSSNNGKYLTTDGSNVSWGTVTAGGGSGTVSSGTINDLAYYSGTTTTASAVGLVYSAASQHLQITSQGPTISPLKLVGASGQSAALLNLSSNTATVFEINASGNVTAGGWNGSAIGVGYGGTGQTTYANGELLIGNSTGGTLTKAKLTAGAGIGISEGAGSITVRSKNSLNVQLASALNPVFGADYAIIRLPESSSDGSTSVTYNPRKVFCRVENASTGTTSLNIQWYTGTSSFSSSGQLLTSDLSCTGDTNYEFSSTGFDTTAILATGTKLRLYFSAVDYDHAYFSINLLLEEA